MRRSTKHERNALVEHQYPRRLKTRDDKLVYSVYKIKPFDTYLVAPHQSIFMDFVYGGLTKREIARKIGIGVYSVGRSLRYEFHYRGFPYSIEKVISTPFTTTLTYYEILKKFL